MKKLFNISEEEKSRILTLHENVTNKQYLSEQAAPTPNQTNTQSISLSIDSSGNFTATYAGKTQLFKPENTLKQVKDVFFPAASKGFQYQMLQADKTELKPENAQDTQMATNLNLGNKAQQTQQVASR